MTIDANKNTSGVVVTAVATTSPDIESQQKQQSSGIAAPTNTSTSTGNPDEGKNLGIAMFVLLIIAFITTLLVIPFVGFACLVATIVISSAITCGCCCASDFNLQPNIKKFATATLVSLVLMFVVQIVWIIGAIAVVGTEASNTGAVSQSTADATTTSALIVLALSLVFNVMAIIFSALFTWGRGIGAQRS